MTNSNDDTATHRAQYIAGLRQLADLLEANPHLTLPLDGRLKYVPISVHVTHDEDQKASMTAWARALPGIKSKDPEGNFFKLRAMLGTLHLNVVADRDEVCHRIVVGTREVVEEKPDPALVAEIPIVPVTTTEEIVEWRCSSLLDDAAAVA